MLIKAGFSNYVIKEAAQQIEFYLQKIFKGPNEPVEQSANLKLFISKSTIITKRLTLINSILANVTDEKPVLAQQDISNKLLQLTTNISNLINERGSNIMHYQSSIVTQLENLKEIRLEADNMTNLDFSPKHQLETTEYSRR